MNYNDQSGFLKMIGERIRGHRKMRKLTIEELAERCEPPLHYNYLGAVERGEYNISITALMKISQALDIPMEELVKAEPAVTEKSGKAFKLKELRIILNGFEDQELEFLAAVAKELKKILPQK